MRGIAAAAKTLGVIIAVFATAFLFTQPTSAQSTIQAQLCRQSQVTITQPAHDGTVNNAVVHFTGTVSNAGQIEVYVDNNYSTQISLADGATTYASDISVGVGTHTIKLVAVGECSNSPNAQATLVVTYAPAKATGPTTTNVSENGSKVDSSSGSPSAASALSPSINNTLDSIARWLNFKTDNQQESQSRLSPVRAITLGAGLVIAVFGIASLIVDWFSQITSGFLFPRLIGQSRITIFRVFFRIVGVAIVLLSLFV